MRDTEKAMEKLKDHVLAAKAGFLLETILKLPKS
ncbi:MAG: hypothetical protein ACJA1W_001244 [Akkermansiaceae bacterium]|jgi:hypothetical protein